MTTGSVPRHLIAFALPLFAGNLLQQMYSLTDSWVVGRFIGDSALAAVGASYPVTHLIVALFSGISIGGTVVIAGYFGAGKKEEAKCSSGTLYLMSLIGAFPMTLFFLFMASPILKFMKADPAFFESAVNYLAIICAGMIGTVGYNVNAGILYGIGDSRSSLIFLIISDILNVGLDFLFVAGFSMGVEGAAYATVIAQCVSWLSGLVYLLKRYPQYMPSFRELRFDKKKFTAILKIGLPAGLQQSITAIGSVCVVARINSFGEAYSAAYNIGNKIDNFIWFAIQSLCSAVTAFTGQNAGVNDYKRVKQGARYSVLFALGICAFFMCVCIPLRFQLVGFFSKTPAVLEAGGEYIWYVIWGYPLLVTFQVLNSVMRGAGDTLVPMISPVISIIVLRLPLIYLITDKFGVHYMYLSYVLGWAFGCALSGLYFLSGRWMRHSLSKTLSN